MKYSQELYDIVNAIVPVDDRDWNEETNCFFLFSSHMAVSEKFADVMDELNRGGVVLNVSVNEKFNPRKESWKGVKIRENFYSISDIGFALKIVENPREFSMHNSKIGNILVVSNSKVRCALGNYLKPPEEVEDGYVCEENGGCDPNDI